MARHFRNNFKGKKKLSITSAYRSFKHQQQLLKSYCKSKQQCAEPGSSEHQAGLALDLGVNGGRIDKKSLERLQENAHKRGFHQSYQKGKEIDGKTELLRAILLAIYGINFFQIIVNKV